MTTPAGHREREVAGVGTSTDIHASSACAAPAPVPILRALLRTYLPTFSPSCCSAALIASFAHMTVNLRQSENNLHSRCPITCNQPASRSFGLEQQRKQKSWIMGTFSSSFSNVTVTDGEAGPIITLTNQNCPAWLLGVVCKGPQFRSIDQQGNMTAGGAYERFGKNARASLFRKSIGPDGNFTNIKFPLFERRHGGGASQQSDLFGEDNDEDFLFYEEGFENVLSGRFYLE
eukprot:763298-Hanusia_phi.AAC.1